MNNAIDICLATYNGELFLSNQIDSIINQSFTNWHLFIRDDVSSDKTLDIINEYETKYPEKITIISDRKGNLGFIQNFNEIVSYTKAPIISFSDQDDIWERERLQEHYELLKNFENIGVLVQSNLIHIDIHDKFIKKSFVDTIKVNPSVLNKNIISALYRAYAVGCAMSINRKLLNTCGQIPKSFPTGHDHWYLFGAILFGQIKYINTVHVNHRIHNSNTSRINVTKTINLNVNNVSKAQIIARCLLLRYDQKLTYYDRNLLDTQMRFDELNLWKRVKFFIQSRVFSFFYIKNSLIILGKFVLFPLFVNRKNIKRC